MFRARFGNMIPGLMRNGLSRRSFSFSSTKVCLDRSAVEKAFGPDNWKILITKMPNWERDFGGADKSTCWGAINSTLIACGIDATKTPGLATDILEHLVEQDEAKKKAALEQEEAKKKAALEQEEAKKKAALEQEEADFRASLVLPPVPSCRGEKDFYERTEAVDVTTTYIENVILGTNSGFKGPLEKFSLLGSSGVKGIGKTEFLKYVAHHILPDIAKKLSVKAVPLYLSFNGSGEAARTAFTEHCRERMKPCDTKELRRSLYDKAFAHVLLNMCGARLKVDDQTTLKDAIAHLRLAAKLKNGDVLVVLVDEIGELGDTIALETMKCAMSAVDAAKGKLVVIFSHIKQTLLNEGAKLSGRTVIQLPLASLPLDIWKKLGNKELNKAAEKHPGVYQLLLSLAGHPRSVFEGLPAALLKDPTLLENPHTSALTSARDVIKHMAKFSPLTAEHMADVVPTWLLRRTRWATVQPAWMSRSSKKFEEQLIEDGLLHQIPKHPDGKFLFPLAVHAWAIDEANNNGVAHHLRGMYAADAMADDGSEKFMEAVMYNFEAARRIGLGKRKIRLREYYGRVGLLGLTLGAREVVCKPADAIDQVYVAPSFDDEIMPTVIKQLLTGMIVVSALSTEVGVEYLVPFFDATTRKLLIGCVQCKFVKGKTSWSKIKVKMAQAAKYLTEGGYEHFPVVYTTVDQKTISPESQGTVPAGPSKGERDGVYFTEEALFEFTNYLGVLRLHCVKAGSVVKRAYPFLDATK